MSDDEWFRVAYNAYKAHTINAPDFETWRIDPYATWLVNVLKHAMYGAIE